MPSMSFLEQLEARRDALKAELDECNRRISEMMPRELTQAQVDGFMLDAPSMDAAIYAAGWNAGRERLEHEENDE